MFPRYKLRNSWASNSQMDNQWINLMWDPPTKPNFNNISKLNKWVQQAVIKRVILTVTLCKLDKIHDYPIRHRQWLWKRKWKAVTLRLAWARIFTLSNWFVLFQKPAVKWVTYWAFYLKSYFWRRKVDRSFQLEHGALPNDNFFKRNFDFHYTVKL